MIRVRSRREPIPEVNVPALNSFGAGDEVGREVLVGHMRAIGRDDWRFRRVSSSQGRTGRLMRHEANRGVGWTVAIPDEDIVPGAAGRRTREIRRGAREGDETPVRAAGRDIRPVVSRSVFAGQSMRDQAVCRGRRRFPIPLIELKEERLTAKARDEIGRIAGVAQYA